MRRMGREEMGTEDTVKRVQEDDMEGLDGEVGRALNGSGWPTASRLSGGGAGGQDEDEDGDGKDRDAPRVSGWWMSRTNARSDACACSELMQLDGCGVSGSGL